MNTATDRRQNDRISFQSLLDVRRVDSAQRAAAEANDLSVSGMSFRTTMPLEVGDEVRIRIAHVVEHATIAAQVRYVAPEEGRFLVGVEHAPVG